MTAFRIGFGALAVASFVLAHQLLTGDYDPHAIDAGLVLFAVVGPASLWVALKQGMSHVR